MFDKLKVILELENNKLVYKKAIEQLKNIPEGFVYVSSVPDETAEDAIKDLEGSIELINLAIEKIKLL